MSLRYNDFLPARHAKTMVAKVLWKYPISGSRFNLLHEMEPKPDTAWVNILSIYFCNSITRNRIASFKYVQRIWKGITPNIVYKMPREFI